MEVTETVEDPVSTEDNAEQPEEAKAKSKRIRPRRQKLYSNIRKQMEFYFSDSNISKNRLMKDIVQKSEYVNLSEFLGFHKIVALTKNMGDIQKALKQSEKLEVSSDALGVKRKIPFDEMKVKDEQSVENCTIYVENIPRNADHEWIEKVFQEFGPLAYISMPKFKHNGKPKGFAFVEYEEQIGADRCLEAYGSIGACLPSSIDPAELQSVQTFEDETKPPNSQEPSELISTDLQEQDGGKQNGSGKKRKKAYKEDRESNQEQEETSADENIGSGKRSRKRGHGEVDTSTKDSDEVVQTEKSSKVKKSRKIESEESESITVENSCDAVKEEERSPKKSRKREYDHIDSPSKVSVKIENTKSGKKRQHEQVDSPDMDSDSNTAKKRRNKSSKTTEDLPETSESEDSSAQQLTSVEPHQEETNSSATLPDTPTIGQVKKKKKRRNNNKRSTEDKLETDLIQLRILPKKHWKQLRNRYLNLQRENMSNLKKQLRMRRLDEGNQRQKVEERPVGPKSICVKIRLEKPADSVESFKSKINELAPKDWSNFIKFIEYEDQELDAVVRFDGGPHARMGIDIFLENSRDVFEHMEVMTDAEATDYWNSVRAKGKNQAKPKKVVRGKDRLTNKAVKVATHIRFDADEDNKPQQRIADDVSDPVDVGASVLSDTEN